MHPFSVSSIYIYVCICHLQEVLSCRTWHSLSIHLSRHSWIYLQSVDIPRLPVKQVWLERIKVSCTECIVEILDGSVDDDYVQVGCPKACPPIPLGPDKMGLYEDFLGCFGCCVCQVESR